MVRLVAPWWAILGQRQADIIGVCVAFITLGLVIAIISYCVIFCSMFTIGGYRLKLVT